MGMTEIDKEDLQTLFDLAITSNDYASGFWEDQDVEVARRIAVLLGVNPMTATPSNFARKYKHEFVMAHERLPSSCTYCSEPKDAPVHQ